MILQVLMAARAISMFGTGLQGVVVAWLVLSHGGTTWHLAAMAALSAGVGVPASFLGGPLVDRFPRWAVTLVAEVGRAVPAAVVALLAAHAELRVEHLLIAATASSALHAVSVAAYGALLPQVLDRGSMVRVNGLWQAVAQIGVFCGAATGGMAISALGGANALWIEVVARALAGAAVLRLARSAQTVQPAGVRVSTRWTSFWPDMVEAWYILREQPALLWISLFAAIPGSLIWGFNVVLPAFAKDVLGTGAFGYGLMDAAWGVGAFCAGLLCTRLPSANDSHRYHAHSLWLLGGATVAFALGPNLPATMVLSAGTGGIALGSLVLHQAYIQARSPPTHTGRIMAMSQLVLSALWLAVALGVGGLALVLPLRAIIIGWGVAIFVLGFLLRLLLGRARAHTPNLSVETGT
ncbi:MAG TPA: MFS transporter [Kofleriaceae bacterium]|nr:MFS transporter [Kofleriaceae bacterium]